MDELINNILHVIENNFELKSQGGIKKLREALMQYMAAFGNCGKCFGRGYSDTDYKYCNCERGKKLEEVKGLLGK